jgi:hypothetical protein
MMIASVKKYKAEKCTSRKEQCETLGFFILLLCFVLGVLVVLLQCKGLIPWPQALCILGTTIPREPHPGHLFCILFVRWGLATFD